MYINTIADSVMLLHDFYNIIFKIKHKLCAASGSSTPPVKNSECPPAERVQCKPLVVSLRAGSVEKRIYEDARGGAKHFGPNQFIRKNIHVSIHVVKTHCPPSIK
jgi:hypothetical protein